MTTLACVIGWPIAHSLSPAIHNAAFTAAGLAWAFRPVGVRPGALAEGMALLEELGAAGVSVTSPHKQDVRSFMTDLSPVAARVGAVNTITRDERGLTGHNTDGAGLLWALQEEVGLVPAGSRAVLLGAGGAARAVAVALADAGASVTVVARRPERAAAIAALAPGIQASDRVPGEADLVVNATTVRDELPFGRLPDARIAADLLYGAEPSTFLASARAAGMTGVDGLGMLIGQAAEAFRLWTGVEAPVDAMRAGAEAALASAEPASGMSDAAP